MLLPMHKPDNWAEFEVLIRVIMNSSIFWEIALDFQWNARRCMKEGTDYSDRIFLRFFCSVLQGVCGHSSNIPIQFPS
jgi:hypothetical protein